MTRDLSPDELAFREAINANPKDDTPKLVYADWLDEHGHPEQATKVRLRTERGQLREAAWTEKVIPTKSFDIDWGGVDLPSHRFALGMIYKAMGDDATIDNHIREMAWAEQSYFQACLYACFGKRAMPLISDGTAVLWQEKQEQTPTQTVEAFLKDRRRELIDEYVESKLVTGRKQAIEFGNEVAATAQEMARAIISMRSKSR